MQKGEDKNVCASDYVIACMNKIDNDIKTVGTRASWLLGFVIVIVLALLSFLFSNFDSGTEVVGSIDWLIWHTAGILCPIYLVILLAHIWPLITPNFGKMDYELLSISEIRKNIKTNAEIFERLNKRFRTLVILFIVSVPASFGFTLLLWYFSI